MPRLSWGSSHADIAVEPTRAQNMTVSWRRSAASFDGGTDDSVATSAMAKGAPGEDRRSCGGRTWMAGTSLDEPGHDVRGVINKMGNPPALPG